MALAWTSSVGCSLPGTVSPAWVSPRVTNPASRPALVVAHFFLLLKCIILETILPSLMDLGLALASHMSVLELAGFAAVRYEGCFQHLLLEAILVTPQLQKFAP